MSVTVIAGAVLVLLLVALDALLVVERHGPPGLTTAVSLAAAAGIVLVAKVLGRILQRRKDPS